MHNNSHSIRNYTLVGLGGAFSGAAALPFIQNLGKTILPALASGLAAFWSSLTGGEPNVMIGSCGMVNGNNNGSIVIYCKDVNISETLTLAVEGDLIYEWNQVIENRLSLDIDSTNTISDNSITSLIYNLSRISQLTETSIEPTTTSCFLPEIETETEFVSNSSEWRFEELDSKKKL